MCKLIIIPKVTDTEKTKLFMRAVVPDFTQNDQDGIGYAALNKNGTLYGERWRYPKQSFKPKGDIELKAATALLPIANRLAQYTGPNTYNSFGVDSNDWTSVIYHSRMATCGKDLANVHPFLSGNTALVHNGVISHAPKEWTNKISTCDSEQILNGYINMDCANVPENFDYMASELSGYMALGVLTQLDTGQWVLDVSRDNQAHLSVVYVKELDGIVFCTDPDIVKSTCKVLQWTVTDAWPVEKNTLIRFDAMTGEVLFSREYDDYSIDYNSTTVDNWSYSDYVEAKDFDDYYDTDDYEDEYGYSVDPRKINKYIMENLEPPVKSYKYSRGNLYKIKK